MERKEVKWLANGLVFYSFGFVLYGHDILASICALILLCILIHEFGIEKMMAHWEYMAFTALAELVVIERSGMSVCRSSLFIVSVVNLVHAYTWCTFDYDRMDFFLYRTLLWGFVITAVMMPSLPLGFVETLLVIFLVFMPYTLLGKQREREEKRVYTGKKHMTVIE